MDKQQLPYVSVIIASYNVESYIVRAIRSALDQQDINVEIILVDDASTDNTVNLAAGISDPRLRIIRRETNGGPSVTRNEGIAAASAPWISILDGDDTFELDRLARCIKYGQSINADIIVDNLQVRNESDGSSYPMYKPSDFDNNSKLDLATFIYKNTSFLGGKALGYLKPIFSASFLRKHAISYYQEVHIGEDYYLMAEALAKGAVCAIEPHAGYNYTVRAGSISHRLTLQDVSRFIEAEEKFLRNNAIDAKSRCAQKIRQSRLLQAQDFTILVQAIKNKDVLRAINIILHSPSSILPLWRPLIAKIKRIIR